MRDGTRVLIGRTMAATAVVAAVVGIGWLLILGYRDQLWDDWMVHNALVGVGTGVIVWLVIKSQPRNGAIWILAWAGLFTGLEVLGYGIAAQWMENLGISTPILEIVPSQVPTGLALVLMQVNWMWMGVMLTLAVLPVFPDGKPAASRWRWLAPTMLTVIGLTMFGLFWQGRPSSQIPLVETQDTHGGFSSITAAFVTLGYPLTFLLGFVSIAALVGRYRRSVGEERQQFRWVVWGASVFGVLMMGALLFDELGNRVEISLYLGAVALVMLISSFGIAIGKYRLYDIDAVISRTLVYGSLALLIGVIYVAIAVLPWVVLGSEAHNNTWLGIAATVVVAVSFQPLRRRMERLANRVVFGRRATPYEVLSTFSQGISAVDPSVLTELAKSLAEGTTAVSASIWSGRSGNRHCIAAWPEIPVEEPEADDAVAVVTHDGEELGLVALVLPAGQSFPPTDRRLLDQVAGGLGLALRNLRLTEDLRSRVEELAASRRRIVAVQDETRRRLERDLHDGAQQRLVALKIKVGIGASIADKAGLEDVKGVLDTVRAETDQTIDSVRDFARGIYPPLLEAEGLEQALNAQARKLPIPVTVQAAGLGRYPKGQEATVYFCVLEALQNAIKHSKAGSVQVVLSEEDGELSFVVRDDGVGFEPARGDGGGLVNMSDRLDALGGALDVTTAPGRGTEIRGRLPMRELVVT